MIADKVLLFTSQPVFAEGIRTVFEQARRTFQVDVTDNLDDIRARASSGYKLLLLDEPPDLEHSGVPYDLLHILVAAGNWKVVALMPEIPCGVAYVYKKVGVYTVSTRLSCQRLIETIEVICIEKKPG